MSEYVGNKALEEKLVDLHNGLHLAMTALIRNNDVNETTVILRQMDQQFAMLINTMRVAPVSR